MAAGQRQRFEDDDLPEFLKTKPEATIKVKDRVQGLVMSYQKLAERVGTSKATVSRFCNGNGSPIQRETYSELCYVLDFNWEDIANPCDSSGTSVLNQDAQKPEPDDIPIDLPVLNENLIGRCEELDHIDLALQNAGRAVVSGMPGVGKSLTALHYADSKAEQYPGGVFWLDAGDDDLDFQIIETAIEQGVTIPNNISAKRHLRYCAKNWPRAPYPVLLILDNVNTQTELEACLKWMPAERFKLLITARPQLQILQVETIVLTPLSANEALVVIEKILPSNDPRLVDQDERAALLQLCGTFLGGLPLALQIVGQALKDEIYLSIADLNEQLRAVGNPFDSSGLGDVDTVGMLDNVKQGVLAVFELSWQALSAESQILGGLISLFSPSQVPWLLIQEAAQYIDELTNPAGACAELRKASLLRRTDRDQFQMHRLLRRFFQLKVQDLPNIADSKHEALLIMCRRVPEQCSQLEAQNFTGDIVKSGV